MRLYYLSTHTKFLIFYSKLSEKLGVTLNMELMEDQSILADGGIVHLRLLTLYREALNSLLVVPFRVLLPWFETHIFYNSYEHGSVSVMNTFPSILTYMLLK